MPNEFAIPRQDHRSDSGGAMLSGHPGPGGGGPVARLLDAIGRDGRVAPVVAGLGGVAGFASLIGEWTMVTIPGTETGGEPLQVPAGVSDVGNFGAAYLVGLFGTVACLALALRGSRRVRYDARLVGLAVVAGLLAVLAAATATLDEAAERIFYLTPAEGLQVGYGRGLVTAYLAVALLGVAVALAGRHTGTEPAEPGAATGGTGDPHEAGPGRYADGRTARRGWPWRRGGTGQVEERDDAGPLELTVAPTPPFVRPEQGDRDR